jgi:hypothetical protein
MSSWIIALSYSNSLEDGECELTDGSSAGDWRLPNHRELYSLIDAKENAPALPSGHPFTNVEFNFYWSSTTTASYTGDAWLVNMNAGNVYNLTKASGSFYVWPVRGGH